MELTSRAQALATGQKRYFTGKPCPKGHLAERRVTGRTCLECHRIHQLTRIERTRAIRAAWKIRNPLRVRELAAARRLKYPGEQTAKTAKYLAKKLRATPVWADEAKIRFIYQARAAAVELFGIEVHVDHAVPLDSPSVCGLHVESNLRLMAAGLNRSKSNRVWPDMWEQIRAA